MRCGLRSDHHHHRKSRLVRAASSAIADLRLERLEDRQMLSLIGVVPTYPVVAYNNTGVLTYDAAAQTLSVDATPLSFRLSPSTPPRVITSPRDLMLQIRVGNDGALIGGVPGDDLVVTGQVDIDGDGNIDASGVLLTGEVSRFGYEDSGTATDRFDFQFTPTGGALAPYFAASDIGMTLTSESSSFAGDFTVNFTGGAKGNIGLVAPLLSSISGYVYHDSNNDGDRAGETPISGVLVTLTGTDTLGNSVFLTATTNDDGFYRFADLRPGTYTITETQPAGWLDGKDTIGTPGGTSGNDVFTDIVLPAGYHGVENNFGELLAAMIDLEKYVRPRQFCAGGEGFTPGFWKQCQHLKYWVGFGKNDSYNAVFGVNDPDSPTLMEALWRGGGGYKALGRHAVAALLNASAANVSYAYSVEDVIAIVRQAYATGEYTTAKNMLEAQNELGGDPDSGGKCIVQPPPGPGDDADEPTGPVVPVGATVVFTYIVNNNGYVSLGNVVLVDDNATPDDETDDFIPTPVTGDDNMHNVGDVNRNGLLDPGESWQFVSSTTVTAGQHTNWAMVTAVPVDEQGQPVGSAVSDSDPANWYGQLPPPPPLPKSSLSGFVYVDCDNDGQIDCLEPRLSGVVITLVGVEDDGDEVYLTTTTDQYGRYYFGNLNPGTYSIIETQPAGFYDGKDTIGSLGGSNAINDTFSDIIVASGQDGVNYNFGERQCAKGTLHRGQTATIGFWQNRNGQALIKSLNGGRCSRNLGNWLAASFPNMFGSLAGKTNEYIAGYFVTKFKQSGMKLDAQVLAVALAVYVTDVDLAGGTMAAKYGFEVSAEGTGAATYNIGANGAAFGVPDNTIMTVYDILAAADARAVGGVLYGGNWAMRTMANNVFAGINEAGDIW